MAASRPPRAVRARKVAALIRRDGLVCCYCGGPIMQDLPRNDPYQLSLEHVVPRALGGSMELSNLKLAHRKCNSQAGGLLSRELDPVQILNSRVRRVRDVA